jgi:hypothetical protein
VLHGALSCVLEASAARREPAVDMVYRSEAEPAPPVWRG